jgi:hypothetical protein
MKYMRRTAGYTWTDYKTNIQIAKELKLTPIFYKLLEYKRHWKEHVNRMPRNRLPRVLLSTISYISDNHQEIEIIHTISRIEAIKADWTPYTGTFTSPN